MSEFAKSSDLFLDLKLSTTAAWAEMCDAYNKFDAYMLHNEFDSNTVINGLINLCLNAALESTTMARGMTVSWRGNTRTSCPDS